MISPHGRIDESENKVAFNLCNGLSHGAFVAAGIKVPREQGSWGHEGAHLGPVGPMWAPCRPHKPCYQGIVHPYTVIDDRIWPVLGHQPIDPPALFADLQQQAITLCFH